jgi:hypothetical protein
VTTLKKKLNFIPKEIVETYERGITKEKQIVYFFPNNYAVTTNTVEQSPS